VNATAARTPGRSEPNLTAASTLARSAIPKASACRVSGTPLPGRRNASSNACSSARAAAPLNTSVSAVRTWMAASSEKGRGGVATALAVMVVSEVRGTP
jgi:hypothetical protein